MLTKSPQISFVCGKFPIVWYLSWVWRTRFKSRNIGYLKHPQFLCPQNTSVRWKCIHEKNYKYLPWSPGFELKNSTYVHFYFSCCVPRQFETLIPNDCGSTTFYIILKLTHLDHYTEIFLLWWVGRLASRFYHSSDPPSTPHTLGPNPCYYLIRDITSTQAGNCNN